MTDEHFIQQQREEHVHIAGVSGKKVFVIDSQGNVVDFGGASNWAIEVDSATTTDVTYVGKAAIGTATSAASWQVFKVDETTTDTASITWADGNDSYDNIWDNRDSLSYS